MPDQVMWGDVATWFTGLVTTGTLVVAVMILWRDRGKAEREQAEKVAVWGGATDIDRALSPLL